MAGAPVHVEGAVETLYVAEIETPIGRLRLASSERGLAYVGLPRAGGRGWQGWQRRFAPGSRSRPALGPNREAARQIVEYLEGRRQTFELPLDLRGTPFQLEVYAELLRIPYAATRSYAEVAERLGRPGAQRAVGAANGANPIPLVVPCHRVVNAHGRLGGYGGGRDLKARLLALESAHAHPDRLL